MQTRIQTYFSWRVSQQRQEDRHGPRHCILPESGLPCQRTRRQGQYQCPLAQGAALHRNLRPQNWSTDDAQPAEPVKDTACTREGNQIYLPCGPLSRGRLIWMPGKNAVSNWPNVATLLSREIAGVCSHKPALASCVPGAPRCRPA